MGLDVGGARFSETLTRLMNRSHAQDEDQDWGRQADHPDPRSTVGVGWRSLGWTWSVSVSISMSHPYVLMKHVDSLWRLSASFLILSRSAVKHFLTVTKQKQLYIQN